MRKLLILLALALLLPAALHAQKAPEEDNPYLKRFQELDADKDGYVTPGEWPLEPESFVVVDRDKDGRLARFELLTPNRLRNDWDPPQPPAPPRVDQGTTAPRPDPENAWGTHVTVRDLRLLRDLDRDRDSRLNRREWPGSAVRFRRLDTNQDGVLSPRELSRNRR